MERKNGMSRSTIKDVWGHFAIDLNFRRHPCGKSNMAQDYPRLSAAKLTRWNKAVNADALAWCWMKFKSGHAAFPSKALPQMDRLSPDFYQRWCELSKKEGMYVMGYTCGGDDVLAFEEHPEWFQEYGPSFVCLNAPFWDREFEAMREALRIYPCDGLFYDMIQFSGNCVCEFCQEAYRKFYGKKMPERYNPKKHHRDRWNWKAERRDVARFRLDTWRQWVSRATQVCREIVPGIEICINQQWLRPDGVPYELLEQFDWYFCEFGMAEWVGEILRAWGGDKHMLCGNVLDSRQSAHLLGRRMCPVAYDTFADYRTGELVSLDDRRIRPIKRVLGETRKCEPYLKGACAIPHAAVLHADSWNSLKNLGEGVYSQIVATYVRDATRMNLSCCAVEIAERLTQEKLAKYEVIFAPDLGCLDEKLAVSLQEWVRQGGILFASGLFALMDKQGETLSAFSDKGLLGVRKMDGPLDTFNVMTDYRSDRGMKAMDDLAAVDDAILCAPTTAEPVAYGCVGAEENVPLLWRNKVGDGLAFYFAGRIGRRIEEDVEKSLNSMRSCLQALLLPHIRKAPFRTSMEYPTEIWLNEQPREHRLVMHIVAFEKPLVGQYVSVRADLIAEDAIEIVYPAAKKTVIKGKRKAGYVQFLLPEVHGHVILVLKKELAPHSARTALL